MDINQLSKKIENKLLKDTSIKDVKIIDNTYKHLKHKSHHKGKFHINLEINSEISETHFLCLNKDFGVIIINGFLNSLCICLLNA